MGMAVKEKDTHIDDNEIDFPAFILNLQILLLQSLVIALQILCLHHRVNFQDNEEATPEQLSGIPRYPQHTH